MSYKLLAIMERVREGYFLGSHHIKITSNPSLNITRKYFP
jgi:hypothetical protein